MLVNSMKEHNKRAALYAAISISLVPCFGLLTFPSVVSPPSLALYASAILGYIGLVLLLWMYVLGTKSVMGLWFTDLAPVLSIHKWIGKYGVVLIAIHPLLITYSYGESLLYSFIPKLDTVAERHILLGQIAFWLLIIIWISSAVVRDKLSWRTWKYLHFVTYVCLPFALLHVLDLGSQEQTHVLIKAYLLLLGLVLLAFSLLRMRSFLNLDRTRYIVVSQAKLTESDYSLRLRPLTSHRLTPKQGQYVYIKLGYLSEDHPFSVVRYDQATDEMVLAYRVFGMYTKELKKLQANSTVFLSRPYGSFMEELVSDDTTPVVYLAGGIGITPFADRIMQQGTIREQWLFAANRSRSSAVLIPTLKSALGDRCICVYNREDGSLGEGEEAGYITAVLLKKYLIDPTRFHYYLCGPPGMIAAMRSNLAALTVPKHAIHSEKFEW